MLNRVIVNYISKKNFIHFFFWVILWFSIGTISNPFNFDYSDNNIIKNIISYLRSNVIYLIFICYLYVNLYKFNFSSSLILLIYPISGFIGYLLNKNNSENFIFYFHFFISLSALFLIFNYLKTNHKFKTKDSIILIKISLFILFIFFILILIPQIILSFGNLNLRGVNENTYNILNIVSIYIPQNSNGASRIILILNLFLLIKANFTRNIKKNFIIYIITYILGLIIYFYQSKFNILIYFIFLSLIIFKNKKIKRNLKFFIIITNIISLILIYSNSKNNYDRFTNSLNEAFKLLITNNYFKTQKENIIEKGRPPLETPPCRIINSPLDNISGGRICGWIILINKIDINKIFIGKGFFEDQKILKSYEKLSSNSYVFLLYNSGLFGLISYIFYFYSINKSYLKFLFKKKNFYQSFTNYLVIYLLLRSLIEDSIVYLSIDLLLLINCLLFINKNIKNND